MTTTTTEQPSEDPNPPPALRRPIFRTETTGDYWSDVREAFKRISPHEDLQNIGAIPCARNSLLNGIASGVGMGVIRGISVHPLVASNWAMGTFVVVSLGTWTICQRKIQEERHRVQTIIEQLPSRVIAKPSEDSKPWWE